MVSNAVTQGQRQARKVLVVQSVAVAVSALAFALLSRQHALAAAWGGGALTLGVAGAAWLALGGQTPAAAGLALARVLAGTVLKWALVFGALLVGLAIWRLPVVALMTGLVVALVAQIIALLRA